MSTDDTAIDGDIQSFLREHVRSFEELETLLLLYREKPRAWSAEQVGQLLHISEIAAEEALSQLLSCGLLALEQPPEQEDTDRYFVYRPAAPANASTVDRLVLACRDRRIEIMKIMNVQSIDRVRTNAMKAFADAFLWGKKK